MKITFYTRVITNFFSAWPTEDNNQALEKMTLRVEHITNLLASSKKGQADHFMCGNYGIGGHYGTHPDYYKYDTPLRDYENINRVSTVMTVLDAPEAGGATVWPFLGVLFLKTHQTLSKRTFSFG